MVCVTGTGRKRKTKAGTQWVLGHHAADRWVDADMRGRDPELFIAGETIAAGGGLVLETMLHEAAHALAHVRGIKDTSSAGRWHNKKFAALAEELGLQPPERAAKVIGFSECLITKATMRRYAAAVRRLDEAGLPYLPDGPAGDGTEGTEDPAAGVKDEGEKTGGKRVVVECSCESPRRLRVTPKILQEGEIQCGNCEQPFATPEQAGV